MTQTISPRVTVVRVTEVDPATIAYGKTLATNLKPLVAGLIRRETTIQDTGPVYEQVLGALKQYMNDIHPGQEHYLKTFATCVLGRATDRIEFKGGTVVEKGDAILVVPRSDLGAYLNFWSASIYSPRSQYGLGCLINDIEVL